jgi:hypothetical protein
MKIILIIIFSISIAGCFDETVRDVPYFVEHKEEMLEKLDECKKSPGEAVNDPECFNAEKAIKQFKEKKSRVFRVD